MKILALTNLFPTELDPLRASFNRQQFDRLGERHDLEVLVAVDFRERRRATNGQPPALKHARSSHFTFWYPPGIGRSLHGLTWYASLLAQQGARLRQEHFDLLLASWAYPDAVGTSLLARCLGIPYVVKVHGSDLNVQANYRLRRPQIASALQGARSVVAVSAALASKVRELGIDEQRVHLLYNGVDGSIFSPGDAGAARDSLGLARDVPIVLYVGNLKASKGCVDLLEAFPQVLQRHPRTQLVFVGGGAAAATLRDRAQQLGIAGNLLLAGARPHHELADWMRAADLLCLPSHNEGVPNVVLEAMACGLPVVATRVGGIPEVLPGHAGILVPPHEPAALAAALDDALARDWSQAVITSHAARFSWDDNIDRLDRIVREAVQPLEHA